MPPAGNSDVMMWAEVLGNFARQAASAARISAAAPVEEFYPELKHHNGDYFITSGAPIIADLVTSPHLVVDLYPLRDENELISQLGVSLKFLCRLRDAGLVTLAINSDIDRFADKHWMHRILADERTLFRPARTPAFFQAMNRDIVEHQASLQTYALNRFLAMSPVELSNYVAEIGSSEVSPDPRGLASQLAWILVRLETLVKQSSDSHEFSTAYDIAEILSRPEQWLKSLVRDQVVVVSPHSNALGGRARYSYDQMARWFCDDGSASVTPDRKEFGDLMYFRNIQNYILSVKYDVTESSLTGADYWRVLRETEEDRLIDSLADRAERATLMQVEGSLRRRILKLDPNIDRQEIGRLIDQDVKTVERMSVFGDLSVNVMSPCVGGAIENWLGWFGGNIMAGAAVGSTGGAFLKGQLRAGARDLLEFAMPRLQVANYVRRTRRK